MKKSEFYLLLDELLENHPGTIQGGEVLAAIPKWDSLALMGFIALVDQHFALILPANRIVACQTVDDLAALLDSQVV